MAGPGPRYTRGVQPITRCPGVVAAERCAWFGYVRWEPAAVWMPLPHKIDDWKGQVHVVAKLQLPRSVREELCLQLPEDQIPPEHRLDLALARATAVVTVSEELRAALLARGVRVWTVGYHRNPGVLRVLGYGGSDPAVWIEQNKYALFGLDEPRVLAPILPGPPIGRPANVPWYGWGHDIDWLDRFLRAATGGVLDEPSILLADRLAREGFGNLHAPDAGRRTDDELRRMIADDPQAAEDGCYAELAWTSQRHWNGDEDAAATPTLTRAVAALASAEGPATVEVEGVGGFWREVLPPMQLVIKPPRPSDGWLPAITDELPDAPAQAWLLDVGAVHRYVRHMGPGAWWEI